MHMAPSSWKWMHHGHHMHVVTFHDAMTHFSKLIHDERFWIALTLAAFLVVMLVLATMTSGSTATQGYHYFYPYGIQL